MFFDYDVGGIGGLPGEEMSTTLTIPHQYLLHSTSMAMDPPLNSSFFDNAQNFAVINDHFTEVVTMSMYLLS